MKKNNLEEKLQLSVCQYLDLQYPNVIYTSDLSGIKLSKGSAVKAKKMRCKKYKIPDLLILHPNETYKGLILELKNKASDVYNQNGTFKKANDNHVEKQYKTIVQLRSLGYESMFVFGLNNAIETIDNYMNNRKPF